MKEDEIKTQKELSDLVMDMSGETHGPDRHVVRAVGYQILSNARLEDAIRDFERSTKKTEKDMRNLAKAQVRLAWAQVILAVAAILAALLIALLVQ